MDKKQTIAAVMKNKDGDIVKFKTSNGTILNYQEAIQEVEAKQIEGLNTFKGKDGEVYIRSNADGNPENNLDQLPQFH